MHAVVHLSKTIILPFSYPLSEEDLQTEANMVFTLGERASRQTYILKVDATDNKLEITSSHSPSLKSRSTNSVRPLLALQYNELMAMYGRDRYTNDCILVASLEGNVIYEFLTFQSKKQMEKLISILVKVKEFQQATSIADSPGNMRPKPDQFFGRSKKQTASTKLFPILRNTYMPRISQMSRCRIANTRRLVYTASTHPALETDIDGLSQSWQNDDKQALWIDGEGEESFHQVNDWLFIHCVCLLLIREFFPGQLSPGSSVESEMTTNLTSNTVSSLSLETVYQTLSKIMEEDCFSRVENEYTLLEYPLHFSLNPRSHARPLRMADIEYYAVTNAWLLHERCVRNVVLLALRAPKAGWLAIEFKTSLNVEVFMNRISCGLKAWSQRSISSEMGGLSFVNSLQSKDNRN